MLQLDQALRDEKAREEAEEQLSAEAALALAMAEQAELECDAALNDELIEMGELKADGVDPPYSGECVDMEMAAGHAVEQDPPPSGECVDRDMEMAAGHSVEHGVRAAHGEFSSQPAAGWP